MIRLASPLLLAALAVSSLALAQDGRQSVAQRNRDFAVKDLSVAAGDTVRFTNDDDFLHQIFVHAPGFSFDSSEQSPGENVDVTFSKTGDFRVLCGIHPKMSMAVHVR
jgi:plastocyanin